MSVYGDIYGTHGNRPYSYNAVFEYGSNRFDVNVTSFAYGLNLKTKSTSSGRQRQVVYPTRVEQTDLSVSLIFRDPEEYRLFGEFVRKYHLASTASTTAPMMWFRSTAIGSGVNYGVTIENASMAFANNMGPAPTMDLKLRILRDMIDTSSVSASKFTGNMSWLVDKLTASQIAEIQGDGVFEEQETKPSVTKPTTTTTPPSSGKPSQNTVTHPTGNPTTGLSGAGNAGWATVSPGIQNSNLGWGLSSKANVYQYKPGK